ncbi:MAG: hypothetical protein KKI08_27990, partial [Armatimonadetes bacterium]|nr:hypothetical protein [Armatimonadota bacterium]
MRCSLRLILLLFAIIPVAAAEGPELLINAGFEQAGPDGAPTGWKGFSTTDWGDCRGQARAVRTDPHAGQMCLELSGVQEQYAAMHDALPIAPGQCYRLRGWIRTELRRGQSAYLVAGWQGDKGWIGNTNLRALSGVTGWTLVEQTLTPASRPANATKLQVSFRISGTAPAGRAWLDDVSLRAVDQPAAGPASAGGDRLLDMARELLIERETWRDRLAMLQQRHGDLQQLLSATGSFAQLQKRYREAVGRHQFLTSLPTSREELERRVPTEAAAVRAQAGRLAELPDLREQCFRQLEATLRLKRQLDADPARRRFFLWAQLAALRPAPSAPAPARAVPTSAEFRDALAHPQEGSGELLDCCVRTELTDTGGGLARLTATLPEALPQTSLHAAVLSPQGVPVAFVSQPLAGTAVALRLAVPQANLWFPDCP